ncbi:MAG TPA: PAS domain S-box protein [Vicinamibacterales bacterium]|nr:PAS domain S-box protein [Acidobacteriota bacterium]HOC18220.1 PAS domain S-box protein [Vicinamibacterales bacterium]
MIVRRNAGTAPPRDAAAGRGRYDLLARHSRDILLFIRRADGRLLEVNEAAVKAYGYTRDELLRMAICDLRAPDTRDETAHLMEAADNQGILFETRHVRKDGSEFPVEVSSQGASIEGTATLLSIVRDITGRKQAEEALRFSEEKFAKIFESNPMAICLTRVSDGRLLDANPAFTEIAGYSREEFEGRTASELGLWPKPEDREGAIAELRRHGFFRNRAQSIRVKSGEIREFLASGELLSIAGEPVMLSTWLDITERRRTEKALEESESFYRQTLESIPGMVFTTRPDGYCDYQSQQWVDFTGVPMPEHLGEGWALLLHPDDRPRALAAWRAAVEGRAPYDLEYRVRRHDGHYEWFKVRGVPIHDAAGHVVRWFGVAANIDAMKRVEEELAAASRAKDQFIAQLSHELRTPLTPAVAAMSLLRTDVRLPADVRGTLAMVSRNLDLEVRLIADLLDVSRVVSGKLQMEKRPVDVAASLREAAAVVERDLEEKEQALAIEMPAAPYPVMGDAARLQQVFWNLLRNAMKFSPEGSHIVVRARVEPVERCPVEPVTCGGGVKECPLPAPAEGHHGGNLVVEVIDRGSGIHPDILPRLFNAFEQDERARGLGGLGLGLSICKAIVEMHGGSIAARSAGPGLGSTFSVRLPLARCALARPAPSQGENELPAPGPGAPRRLWVLVVEDHADSAEMMALLLESMGHDAVVAPTAGEALAAVERQRFDLLISDIGLPDASGYDLMRQLAANGQHIPAIALSGYGTAADLRKSREAGFAEHLVKPLPGPGPLEAAIARLDIGGGRRS